MLHAAAGLADENGIASLSMRKLGEALGVEAMSLYNHVANKDQLLDGMVDYVFSEIGLPAGRSRTGRRPCASGRSAPARSSSRHPLGDRPDVVADLTRSRHAADTHDAVIGSPAG